jgi:hypothetical protein
MSKMKEQAPSAFVYTSVPTQGHKFSLSGFRCYLFNSHPETHVCIPEPGSESNSDVVHAHTWIFESLRYGNPGFDSRPSNLRSTFSLLHAFFNFTPTHLSNLPGQVRPAVLNSLSSSAVFYALFNAFRQAILSGLTRMPFALDCATMYTTSGWDLALLGERQVDFVLKIDMVVEIKTTWLNLKSRPICRGLGRDTIASACISSNLI